MWNEIVQVVWIEWMMVLRRWKRGGIPSLLENHQTNNNDDGDHDNARKPALPLRRKKRGTPRSRGAKHRTLPIASAPSREERNQQWTTLMTRILV